MKIIKHSAEHFPRPVAGPLLGFDVHQDVLKITQTHRFPAYTDEGSPYKSRANTSFQEELLLQLKEDSSSQLLGWYQTSISGKFVTDSLLESLAYGQLRQSSNSIVLIHDPAKAQYGVLSLRAYRLSKTFLDIYTANDFSAEALNKGGLSFDGMFEELPVQIHNNHLASLLLASEDAEFFNNTQALDASSLKGKALAGNVEALIDSVDELNQFYYQLSKKKEQTLQEWLPLCEKISYTAGDVEQQVVGDFLTETALKG